MVAVTSRTEYLSARHHLGARAAWSVLAVGMVALIALGIADVDGDLTAIVVFAAVALSLACAAWGRLGRRGAVLLTVADDTVTFGNEGHRLTSYPLSSLLSASTGKPATSTTMSQRVLTVAGLRYLTMEFEDPSGPDAASDIWQVAIVETDPVGAAIIERLTPSNNKVRRDEPSTPRSRPAERVNIQKESRAQSRATKESSGYDAPRIATAGSDEAAQRLWESATKRHDEVLRAYGAYELEPETMLRYPAVTDITLTPVQDFHDALSDAQALRTDRYPGDRDVADEYQHAVRKLSRVWIACEANGRKVGTGYLGDTERDGLDTALKLVTHARGSATPQEQATYYQRAHRIVAELRDQGAIHPPAGAVAQLEANAQRALPTAD